MKSIYNILFWAFIIMFNYNGKIIASKPQSSSSSSSHVPIRLISNHEFQQTFESYKKELALHRDKLEKEHKQLQGYRNVKEKGAVARGLYCMWHVGTLTELSDEESDNLLAMLKNFLEDLKNKENPEKKNLLEVSKILDKQDAQVSDLIEKSAEQDLSLAEFMKSYAKYTSLVQKIASLKLQNPSDKEILDLEKQQNAYDSWRGFLRSQMEQYSSLVVSIKETIDYLKYLVNSLLHLIEEDEQKKDGQESRSRAAGQVHPSDIAYELSDSEDEQIEGDNRPFELRKRKVKDK